MKFNDDLWAIAVAVVLLAIGTGMAAMFFASAYKMLMCGAP